MSQPTLGPTNTSNYFDTRQVRPWNQPQNENSKEFPIPASNLTFPLGLARLDVSHENHVRIKAVADSVTEKSVRMHLDSWADTTLYSAGCTWLDLPKNDRDFQWGTFATTDDHPWTHTQAETSRYIKFEKPFAYPPKVVLWFNELSLDRTHAWRVKTYATGITTEGFTLHIDSWSDAIIISAATTWIAHPANRSNIASGEYNTNDIRPWDQPRTENQGKIAWGKTFEKPPQVYTALNWISISNADNLRISSLIEDVTTAGMTWHLNAQLKTTLYSAGAAWLAIQDF